jgi:serine/threonine protein phosphatase PrpC/predicted DNA-binding protein
VSETASSPSRAAPSGSPGPTISFGFNLGKIPDQGEDADPILRDGRDLGLVAVFDGMGGAGGTVYETPDGPRTGAYLASRVARDVVERRMLDLLEPDWNLNGRAAAEDLHRSVRDALVERLAELKAPASGLRSRLLRALPTTMALVALQRTLPGGDTWACHVLWVGDSRAYAFERDGLRQLTTDDLRDPGDAMANLSRDSVVSNAMSADTDFSVNYRKVELRAPFVVACATDGCFGYVRSPMHFEHLVLSRLRDARSTDAWSQALQADIAAVTGDDAAMSLLGIGAQFRQFQELFAPRVEELERQFIGPLEERANAVVQAEQQLAALRRRQLETTAEIWGRYKPAYERYLQEHALEDVEELSAAESAADEVRPATSPAEEVPS